MNNLLKLEKVGREIKHELFQKFSIIKEGHPGSILSIFDVVNCLYEGGYLRIGDRRNYDDTFIMSKGHAASVQYPFLVRKGVLPKLEWDNWGIGPSCLRVFGNTSIPGIDVTSGSLGHGIGIASGMALADRNDRIARNIVVIVSEGEFYEGSTWEALLFLAHHRLHHVKIIVDVNNNMILGSPDECLALESFENKFNGFGFRTKRFDGHDYEEITGALDFLFETSDELSIIIADTIKGKGVSFMEGQAQSHYWAGISDDQIQLMLQELQP